MGVGYMFKVGGGTKKLDESQQGPIAVSLQLNSPRVRADDERKQGGSFGGSLQVSKEITMTFNPDAKNGHDVFDDAEKANNEPRRWFGQVMVDAFKCVLITGQGKVPFDPAVHSGMRVHFCYHFSIVPVDPTLKMIEKSPLSWTSEYKQVISPSLDALASKIKAINPMPQMSEFIPVRSVSGLWCGGVFVPKPDNKPGETYETIKFTDVYPDQAACEAAWKKASEQPADDTQSPQPAANGNGSVPVQTVDPNRMALIAAFPAIWAANSGDKGKFLTAIASVFPADAPEVEAFIAAQPGQAAF